MQRDRLPDLSDHTPILLKGTRLQSGLTLQNETTAKWAKLTSTIVGTENPDFADFKIELSDGYTFLAHRSVLYQRNEYFDAMCGLRSKFGVSWYFVQFRSTLTLFAILGSR